MKTKKILSALLSGVIAFSAMAASTVHAFAASSGSEKVSVSRVWDGSYDTDWFTNDKDSYDIYTAEELAGLAYICDNALHADRFNGVTINLMDDIVLNDTSNFQNWEKKPPKNLWEPIGMVGDFLFKGYRPFAGTFNGNGHTISGMYTKVEGYQFGAIPCGLTGLFECLCGAQIMNLRMEKCYAESNGDAGIIAGVSQGTIYKSVEIDNCKVAALSNAGGITGQAYKFIQSGIYTVLGYFVGAGVTGVALNPLFFGESFAQINDPASMFFYACKVSDTKISGNSEGNPNTGGLAGGSGLPTGIAYCLIENNVFSGNAAAAIPSYPSEKDHYIIKDSYSYNNKDGSGKKAALTDSKLVKEVKKATLIKSSFVKKLNSDFYSYDKGSSPKLKSSIETPIDVALHGQKATISWEKVDNAVKYKVYYKDSNGKYQTLSTTRNLTATLTNVKKGTKYSILIRAYFKDGKYETVEGGKFSFKA
ncbi:MAG: fibronectin type III domain-containing protein [Oscillospiraceae bacterium]|nr:fibronectin type III domain-containing protein [Oscillospiraceae bacterium]